MNALQNCRLGNRRGTRDGSPRSHRMLRLLPLLPLLLGVWMGLNGSAATTRVTVLPISTDDHSYRSWRGAADLGDIVVANLSTLPDIALVERADLSRIESERALVSAGLVSPGAMTPLQSAGWAVAVHLGEANETLRPLQLQVIDLARSQTLYRTNLNLTVPIRSRLSADTTMAGEIASRIGDALRDAKQADVLHTGRRRALWFTPPTGTEPPGWYFIRPESIDATLEESALSGFGLVRDRKMSPADSPDFIVWSPRPDVVELGNADVGGVFPTNALAAWEDAIGRLQPVPPSSEPVSKRASAALHLQGQQKLSTVTGIEDAASRTTWRDGLSLLGQAIWLDPSRIEAQELLLRARFAPWVGRVSAHPLRWRYWRREAWGDHVRRYGFETRADGLLDEELERTEFRGEPRTVAWQYVHSAYAILRSYAPGQGYGSRDRWPSDLDSRVLETWWGRDLAELRTRLERTERDPNVARLRLASAQEVLIYGAGPDAAGWCRWLEKQAPELRKAMGAPSPQQAAQFKRQLDHLYESAGRPGEYSQVLAILVRPDPKTAVAVPSKTGPRLSLPRVSQLDSLAARPALDAGHVELGPVLLTNAVRTLQLPGRSLNVSLVPPGRGERWLMAEVSTEPTESGPTDPQRAVTPLAEHHRILLRSRGDGPFEPIPSHPLFQSTIGIIGHRGDLWGYTATAVWRIAAGKSEPQSEAQGLSGPIFGLHSVAGRLLVSGQGVHVWLPEERRWESWVSHLPARGPGNSIALTFQPGHLWIRRFQNMTLPTGGQGLPEAVNPPWHAWQSGRWTALSVPRVNDLHLDDATNVWCIDQGSLRLLTPAGTNLWPEVAFRNPVVWRDPWAVMQVGEPSPTYLQSREGPPTLNRNATGFEREYAASELDSLRGNLALRPSEGNTVAGQSRLDDPVVRIALSGDYLWLATHRERVGIPPVTRLSVIHVPTRRWIAAMDLPGPLKHLAAGPDGILAVTGDRRGFNPASDRVHEVDIRSVLAVPESAWLSPNPTPAELDKALRSLTRRQRAIRAWAQGDPRPLQTFLAGMDLNAAGAEDLFLLAYTGAEDALRRQAKDTLRRDHPNSLFTAALPDR